MQSHERTCWRLVETPPAPGAWNMAVDQALADTVREGGPPVLRVYRWSPACLSLGRNQPADGYDRDEIRRRGMDVVRRPTGGRAVLHWREVTYCVAAPEQPGEPLRAAYARINRVLRRLGDKVPRPVTDMQRMARAQALFATYEINPNPEILPDVEEVLGRLETASGIASAVNADEPVPALDRAHARADGHEGISRARDDGRAGAARSGQWRAGQHEPDVGCARADAGNAGYRSFDHAPAVAGRPDA